jgi:alanyl-tRNA synthetase
MGLERLAAVMQGVHSNYEIDLFRNLIKAAAEVTGTQDLQSSSLKVIADHIRAVAFLIVDGVLPANEGRGYVLRRIMRRAIRHGYKLGAEEAFLHKLINPLVAEMGSGYPELRGAEEQIVRIVTQEEERFTETLDHGMRLLEHDIERLSGRVIPGETIFRLYDTYGFPVDLTADVARERGLALDMAGFERAMEAQRERARAASQFSSQQTAALNLQGCTQFLGYEFLQEEADVISLVRDGHSVESLQEGQEGMVVLERTPFYAESGGQVGDTGCLQSAAGEFQVSDTQKQGDGVYVHIGFIKEGTLHVGDRVRAQVDAVKRQATALNHSATHLLHAALRRVLGTHVIQKGSLVDADRLRFDFSHFEPLSAGQLAAIEHLVNAQIRANVQAETRTMALEEAMHAGALALFGEKYDKQVRVLRMGDFSTELCGGTHVRRTGDIGLFKIVSETGIAAGIRRIEAVTGERALDYVEEMQNRLRQIGQMVKGDRSNLDEKVYQLVDKARRLEKEIEQLKTKLVNSRGSDLTSLAVDVDGIKVVAARLENADVKTLRNTVDRLKDKLKAAAVVLAAVEDGKVRLVAGVTANQTERIKAGELVNVVAHQIGGKGGGRADMAQAGGNDPLRLDAALQTVPTWVKSQLS